MGQYPRPAEDVVRKTISDALDLDLIVECRIDGEGDQDFKITHLFAVQSPELICENEDPDKGGDYYVRLRELTQLEIEGKVVFSI